MLHDTVCDCCRLLHNAEANKHLWALRPQLHPRLHQAFDAGAFLPDGDLASNLKPRVVNELAGSTDDRTYFKVIDR